MSRPCLPPSTTFRRVWDETLSLATLEEVEEARKRSLRRHAIETGIIERLYDLDWGVTLVYTDSADARWPEVSELVDRTLAAAIASFSNTLG